MKVIDDLLLIEVPINSYGHYIHLAKMPSMSGDESGCGGYRELWWKNSPFRGFGTEILPAGNWQIIGTITKDEMNFDITPFLLSEDFTDNDYDGNIVTTTLYWDYIEKSFSCRDWEDSMDSLLASHGIYFENPLQEKWDEIQRLEDYDSEHEYNCYLNDYNAAQSQVVTKLLALKKVND